MEFIYVLKCQKDKFFIGKTYNVQIEYNEHLDGTFCDLTKEFKPYDIECIFELNDKITLENVISSYVKKYEKTNIFFIDANKKEIKNLLKNENNYCVCKSKEHWLTECPQNTKKEFWAKIFNNVFNKLSKKLKKIGFCPRCGREGHDMNDCYAKTHIDGFDLSDDEDSDLSFI
jgi:predicted GIY-YIG superfamily endonuclease